MALAYETLTNFVRQSMLQHLAKSKGNNDSIVSWVLESADIQLIASELELLEVDDAAKQHIADSARDASPQPDDEKMHVRFSHDDNDEWVAWRDWWYFGREVSPHTITWGLDTPPDLQGQKPTEVYDGYDAVSIALRFREWDYVAERLGNGKWLSMIARAVLLTYMIRIAEFGNKFTAKVVAVRDRKFARVPKVVAGITWAFGGKAGTPDTFPNGVNVGDRRYASAGHSLLLPPTMILLPSDASTMARQETFLLEQNDAQERYDATLATMMATSPTVAKSASSELLQQLSMPPIALSVGTMSGSVLSPTASRVALLVLASGSSDTMSISLGELTRTVMGGDGRARSLVKVSEALGELSKLHIFYSDRTFAQAFQVRRPINGAAISDDQIIEIGPSRFLLSESRKFTERHRTWRGDLIFDLSGVLAMGDHQSAALRLYMRYCAAWNAASTASKGMRVDDDRLSWLDGASLARVANALPPKAIEYLANIDSSTSARSSRDTAVHDFKDHLDYLDASGLAIVESTRIGKAIKYRLRPPEEYNEARLKNRRGEWLRIAVDRQLLPIEKIERERKK